MDAAVTTRSRKPHVAFVVQRCGDDVRGGAERLCLQHAIHMTDDWDCEILTTCARDAATWRNEFAAGETTIGGVHARRFSVARERDAASFEAHSRRVVGGGATLAEQETWLRAQGPDAPGLTAHLAAHADDYDAVFFYSYLYATTHFALPSVAAKAVLVPLAHDEWMFWLSVYDRTFLSSARVACVSEDERRLVSRRFPGAHVCDAIVAPGIDVPITDASRFRRRYAIDGPYAIYLGRVDAAKGVDDLVAFFLASNARNRRSVPRKLVLVGPVSMKIPAHGAIVALGAVDEADKWDALVGADFAIVPSAYESLSLAALEAWAVGKAVVANGASSVLVGQCRRTNAGLWYANENEFVALLASDLFGVAGELGRRGAAYVTEHYTWPATRLAMLACLP